MYLVTVYNSGFALPERQKKFAEDLRQACESVFKGHKFSVAVFGDNLPPNDPTFVVVEGFPANLGSALLASTFKSEILKLHKSAGLNRDIFIKAKFGDKDIVSEHRS